MEKLEFPELKTEIFGKILLDDMLECKGTEYPNAAVTQLAYDSDWVVQLAANATIFYFLLSLKHPHKFC